MKIDFNYQFKNLEGENIRETTNDPKKKGPLFILRKACVNSLLALRIEPTGRPEQISGEKKVERYLLAERIHKSNGLVDLRVEEIKLLKDLIAKDYPPLTVGQAWEILDPTN